MFQCFKGFKGFQKFQEFQKFQKFQGFEDLIPKSLLQGEGTCKRVDLAFEYRFLGWLFVILYSLFFILYSFF